jgi:type I restriction enzyme R subunit
MSAGSANFDFLAPHDGQLVRLGALAERFFRVDPNTSIIKLRQFAELLAQLTAAKTGLYTSIQEPQADLLRRLAFERVLPREVADLFHQLRIAGNKAAHAREGDYSQALTGLKIARQLGVWFHRTFFDPGFAPGSFTPPPDPAVAGRALREELERLRRELDESRTAVERAQAAAEESEQARLSAEERVRREQEERAQWERVASEAERAKTSISEELAALQAIASSAPAGTSAAIINQAAQAASGIELDEAATRVMIDQKLRDRGWEADTQALRHSAGTRPAKGRMMAIAEWPTKSGPADYALFIGTKCIGMVEAKRKRRNVSSAVEQAERYSKGFEPKVGVETIGESWGEFAVPFVFAANGRPYLKQIETESGIWFRDARRATNLRRALVDWPTPDGLQAMLEIDAESADADLKARPIEFAFPLRPYQRRAIEAVERHLAEGRRSMLVAMATGTGKTKLAIALLYRLLASRRFRRVCFVVDRNALGVQTAGEFATTRIVSAKTFADIFGLKGLDSVAPDSETRVHICTIQGLVKRVLYTTTPSEVPPVDQYDLMVVDECHRGYLLDREMSDAELSFRSQEDYVSKYRRVLEHFDAVKIGLTATPALHTVEIFKEPVFTYSYREAVVDGYLIDHEPPVQIVTALAQAGIIFAKGEAVDVIDARTGEVDLVHMPDEVKFQVDEFNKKVVTLEFNRAVAEELARHIDPNLPGKTLVFAVTDKHADIIVDQLKKAFAEAYGDVEDAAIRKITGVVDRVGDLIKSYRNDALPKIAVTVDLLTTGIDVPRIENIVFLRRVNSRILYEQMLGRATRRCDEIGKEVFRIFDAVDLYPHLQNLTGMRPVVVNPSIGLEQLFEELASVEDEQHQKEIRDQILVRLRRRLRKLHPETRARYEHAAGEKPEDTLKRFEEAPPSTSAEWLRGKGNPGGFGQLLEWDPDDPRTMVIPISNHPDQVVTVTRGYGDSTRPEDFLDGFTAFIRGNLNKIAALLTVVQRPRELTREQLRDLRLELDVQGFSETALRKAWSDAKNEDIAASVIGFIRQAALGDPLVPYEDRVRAAIRRILGSRSWTEVQKKWLKRIEEQITRELVVDRAALDEEPFAKDGGFQRLNKVFGGQLETVLGDINDEIWKRAG